MEREVQAGSKSGESKQSKPITSSPLPPCEPCTMASHAFHDVETKVGDWLKSVSPENYPNCIPNCRLFQKLDFLCDLTVEIDPCFSVLDETESENCFLIMPSHTSVCETPKAKATGNFPVNQKDLGEISSGLHDKILQLETQKLAQEKN